jgi:hypothetical protein
MFTEAIRERACTALDPGWSELLGSKNGPSEQIRVPKTRQIFFGGIAE